MLQCGRYALEILSSTGFRTHCLGALIVGGCIQLLYYDRPMIIVCKPIHMFKRGLDSSGKTITLPDITDEFGALFVGLSRLTLEQRGIQEQLCVDRALIEKYETCMTRCGKAGEAFDQRDIFKGVKLPLNLKSDKVHKWLYDHPRILHRDISPGNIMWRRTADGHICGVLNDFDLSSLRSAIGASSTQRTGTLPYMAYELLFNDENGQPPKYLYRHDVESIFYVILLLSCRYKFMVMQNSSQEARRKVPSQFDPWYTHTCAQLKTEKGDFMYSSASPMVNSGFHDFQAWVDGLYPQF
ncbi:hypothetical protein EDD18DRAFT_1251994, partial [Armillaria luteobubalina]